MGLMAIASGNRRTRAENDGYVGQKETEGVTMKKLTICFITIMLIFSMGCATKRMLARMNKIELGMTKAEVVNIMGKPLATAAHENEQYLYFRSHKYFVRLTDGKVDAYGREGEFGSPTHRGQRVEMDVDITNRPVPEK